MTIPGKLVKFWAASSFLQARISCSNSVFKSLTGQQCTCQKLVNCGGLKSQSDIWAVKDTVVKGINFDHVGFFNVRQHYTAQHMDALISLYCKNNLIAG